MYRNLNIYVDLKQLFDNESNFQSLQTLIEFAYQHHASVFYQKSDLPTIEDFDELYCESQGNKLAILLENAKVVEANDFLFAIQFAQQNTSLLSLPFSIITNSDNCIISRSDDCGNKTFLSVQSSEQFSKIEAYQCFCLSDLASWIFKTVPHRVFNPSPKHGNKDTKAFADNKGKKVSQMHCLDSKAQELLNTAIPDFRQQTKRLYNYDSANKVFVEFFYEGENPQNQWHGMSLDETDAKRVPVSVVNILKYLHSELTF